jgi:hypothetical protein
MLTRGTAGVRFAMAWRPSGTARRLARFLTCHGGATRQRPGPGPRPGKGAYPPDRLVARIQVKTLMGGIGSAGMLALYPGAALAIDGGGTP